MGRRVPAVRTTMGPDLDLARRALGGRRGNVCRAEGWTERGNGEDERNDSRFHGLMSSHCSGSVSIARHRFGRPACPIPSRTGRGTPYIPFRFLALPQPPDSHQPRGHHARGQSVGP